MESQSHGYIERSDAIKEMSETAQAASESLAGMLASAMPEPAKASARKIVQGLNSLVFLMRTQQTNEGCQAVADAWHCLEFMASSMRLLPPQKFRSARAGQP